MSHRIETTENHAPCGDRRTTDNPAERAEYVADGHARHRSTGRRRQKPAAPSRYAEISARWVIGVYSFAAILTSFAWILSPLRHGRGFTWWEVIADLLNIPSTHTLPSAITLIVVVSGLIARKRAALYVVIAFQIFGALLASHSAFTLFFPAGIMPKDRLFSSSIDTLSILCAALLVPFLVTIRSAFPARVGRLSWAGALATAVGGIALTTLALWYLCKVGWWPELRHVSAWELLLHGLGIERMHPGLWSADLVGFIASVGDGLFLVLALYQLARGYRAPDEWDGEKELQIRALLQHYGANDSLSYFATRRDKQVIFSSDRRAAITYRTVGSVCLASSDPVGDPHAWQDVIERWMLQARSYGWVPAALSVSEAGARAYSRAGLSVLQMGEEAVLETDRFTLNDTSMLAVRQAVQRVRRGGYGVQIRRYSELDEDQKRQIQYNIEAWRHGRVERGFSMALNRINDPADQSTVLVSAHDGEGRMVALLSFVPWGPTGLSLDIMRRSPEAPNGVVEFMVASLMERAASLGVRRVSLNFAMFGQIFAAADRVGASAWNRFASRSLGVLDRFLQLRRLYRFNLKFSPRWVPRYLACEPTLALVNVAVAASVAEGFLPDLSARRSWEEHRTLSEGELVLLREMQQVRAEEHPQVPRSQQTQHRLRHLQELRDAGMNPYPIEGEGVAKTHGWDGSVMVLSVPEALDIFSRQNIPGEEYTVSGRVRALRDHGGVLFVTLFEAGKTLQVILERELVGEKLLTLASRALDTGDLIETTGTYGTSRTGTPSLIASGWRMAAKSLHPIPFDSFTDPEARLRRRSTDLIVNPDQMRNLRLRTAVIKALRARLDTEGFLEVETPILHTVHGGASARPFRTYINAYGEDLTLRIAPELYLKRLVVGGSGPVYELGRDFRNEGADATHNPEFTVLEAYRPHADYVQMRQLTERLIKDAARAVFGTVQLPLGPKSSLERVLTDVSGPWRVVSVCGALSEALGRRVDLQTDFEELLTLAQRHGVRVHEGMGPGAIIEELYGELVEAVTVEPTFYTDFPAETSPLAAPHRSVPGLAERWDLVINGMEMGCAYSELTDALVQRERLTEQSLRAAAGDPEAMEVDEDFLYALETGMPPTGGLGLGVDRLVMLLAQTQIRGVLSFPFVKPRRS